VEPANDPTAAKPKRKRGTDQRSQLIDRIDVEAKLAHVSHGDQQWRFAALDAMGSRIERALYTFAVER
jgi:hypothetical protein